MKPIAVGVNKLINKILIKQHPILAEAMMNWGKIVGVKFSSKSIPMKIISGMDKGKKINILYIAVDDPSTSLEMAYQQDLMIERIAVYLGYKGIHKIKLLIRG